MLRWGPLGSILIWIRLREAVMMILIHSVQVLIRLQWRASRWCDMCLHFVFTYFPSWPAPFEPGGHPGEPWPEAAYWRSVRDHSSWEFGRTAAEILIALKAGVEKKIPFFLFVLNSLNLKSNTSVPLSLLYLLLKTRGLLRDSIATTYSLVVGFIRNPNASTKNSWLNIVHHSVFWFWSSHLKSFFW